jgi:Transposase DDE domain
MAHWGSTRVARAEIVRGMARKTTARTPASAKPATIATPFLDAYHELFDYNDILGAARQLGVIERDRKVDLPALVESSVLAMSGLPGTQTTIYSHYIQLTGQTLAPSAFYDRFTRPYAELMAHLANRAILAVRAVGGDDPELVELGELLEHFKDIRVADSSCLLLQKLAAKWAPSTSKKRPAGVKLHAVISLRDNLPVGHHLSPQRAHDNKQLDESTLTSGTLFLFDLGYTDQPRLIRLVDRGVHVLARLKSNQNPRIKRVYVGRGDKCGCRGMTLDEAIAAHLLDFKMDSQRGVLDIDVEIEGCDAAGETQRRTLRVVGLSDPTIDEGSAHFYLTSVGRDVLNAQDVSLAYTLRWEIELLWKHLKTGLGLSAIRAWREAAVTALIHAKVTAAALARLLELSIKEQSRDHATAQLAIVLTLNRMVPMIMAMRLRGRGVTLEEMERRMLLLAMVLGRSRRQRRERAKRARRAEISAHG